MHQVTLRLRLQMLCLHQDTACLHQVVLRLHQDAERLQMQERLAAAQIAIFGPESTGSLLAELLVEADITLALVDRDRMTPTRFPEDLERALK